MKDEDGEWGDYEIMGFSQGLLGGWFLQGFPNYDGLLHASRWINNSRERKQKLFILCKQSFLLGEQNGWGTTWKPFPKSGRGNEPQVLCSKCLKKMKND